MTKQRESSFELLRIISILMIVIMHSMAPLLKTHNIFNQEMIIGINAVANIGVTLFVLISGYFGLKFRLERFLSIIGIVFFYSIFSFIVDTQFLDKKLVTEGCIRYFLPLMCNKFWFITCYIILYCLSPWINKIPKYLPQKSFKKLLLLLITFFWIIPTFVIFYEILNDGGKGIINMITIYLIGRYIRLYGLPTVITKHPVIMAIGACSAIALLNNWLSFVYFQHLVMRFSRDNDFFILVESIAVFYIFMKLRFKNNIINYFAGFAFPLYLINNIVLSVIRYYYPFDINSVEVWRIYAISIIVVLLCCLIVEILRRLLSIVIPFRFISGQIKKISGSFQ